MNNFNIFSYLRHFLLFGAIFLSGCQGGPAGKHPSPPPATFNSTSNVPSPPAEDDETASINHCRQHLTVLAKINPATYEKRQSVFNGLIDGASRYTTVRQDISGQTRDTVDALYKYKTRTLCQDIERDILQTLVSRGENLK